MCWVLHVEGRDVKGRANFTCVQLRIPSTCMTFLKGHCVRFSPEGSSVSILGTLEDTKIPRVFNYVILLIDCQHYLGDRVTYII